MRSNSGANNVANGFSLREGLTSQGVTEERSLRHHMSQAMTLVTCGVLKSFAHYRVPFKDDPNVMLANDSFVGLLDNIKSRETAVTA